MTETHTSFWARHRWIKWVVSCVHLVLVALAIAISIAFRRAEPFLRARIVAALERRFHARVELDSFHVSLVKGIQAEGRGLRIWPPDQADGASGSPNSATPLIRIDEFHFHAPLQFKPAQPIHISLVELQGLDIDLPPKSHFPHSSDASKKPADKGDALVIFAVDKVDCAPAHLTLETSKPGKLPIEIAIAHFQLTGAGGSSIDPDRPMSFTADLTNPRPVGDIHTTGILGPWQAGDPGESPVEGAYTFNHADLASIKGIAGILSSTGKYQGTLRNLTVNGSTDTPDFRLSHFGNALPLHTSFHAIVDATNGDTQLAPVDATLGHSHFTCTGQVVRVPDPNSPPDHPTSKGHDIALNVNVDAGRVEDFLRLASHGPTQLLTGALTTKAALHIPPGPESVHLRLNLKGAFHLDQARFTSTRIQDGITQLSMRGQGLPKEIKTTDPSSIHSAMQGDFQMSNGIITLPSFTYSVPGADIQLQGTYGIEGGAIEFAGTAKLQATVSKMVGGVWGILLKPADRYFEKDGAGTEVPIKVSGTRDDPKFGIDFSRMRKKSPPTPEQQQENGKP